MKLLHMYDDVTTVLIPADAEAAAGYINGRWANYASVVERTPHAKHLSIDVNGSADADCLDVEKGDASNATAPAWVKRQIARGVYKPVVYTSVSNAHALLLVLAGNGIQRDQIRLWTAHYTFHEHICDPTCGFEMPTRADGTQYTDNAEHKSLDESLLADGFFDGKPVPKPIPKPVPPGPVPAGPVDPREIKLRSATGYVAWRDWRVAVGAWAGRKPMDPTVRPNVPKRIPIAWRLRLRLYAKFRMKHGVTP